MEAATADFLWQHSPCYSPIAVSSQIDHARCLGEALTIGTNSIGQEPLELSRRMCVRLCYILRQVQNYNLPV